MHSLRLFFIVIMLTRLCTVAQGRLLNVPEEYETIQAGIDAAEEGDTVLVAPGVYQENIVLRTADITLGSKLLMTGESETIDSTIIDGRGRDCVISIELENEDSIILRGFTVCNGTQEYGGGIDCQGGNPHIEDMVIKENRSGSRGGGVWVTGSSHAILRRCRIIGNETSSNGGGIGVFRSYALLENCQIIGNQSLVYGGGIYCTGSDEFPLALTLNNVLIVDNRAQEGGGGGSVEYGQLEVNHCTVTRNSGGFNNGWHGAARIEVNNSIFYSNGRGADIIGGYEPITISYSVIEGGEGGVAFDVDGELEWGNGNIDADPLFRDAENGDFRLAEDSPCIDAGDPDSEPDPDGSRADMGAFYFHHNRAPEIVREIADMVVDEDCGYGAFASLDTLYVDPDGDELGFTVEGSEELGLTFDEEGVLGLEPALNFFGDSLVVTISAFDAEDTTSYSFSVTVNPINDAPMEFGLISPANGEGIIGDFSTRFLWEESSDPDLNSNITYVIRMLHIDAFDDSIIYHDWMFETDTSVFEARFDTMTFGSDMAHRLEWWVVTISGQDSVESREHFWNELAVGGSVNDPQLSAFSFQLSSAYPNPFNSQIAIEFDIPKHTDFSIKLYDNLGRRLNTLYHGAVAAGSHRLTADLRNYPTGVYLLVLESDDARSVRKVELLK